jgi:hypothetical protein
MNVCFNGCSFTAGDGFQPDQREYYIYDRLLEKKFKFNRLNIAQNGSSNYTIFMRSAGAIMSKQYNCVVTQWTALNRVWLCPGPDSKFFSNDSSPDFNYRNIQLNAEENRVFKNTLLLLNGDYNNIVDLIEYSKILESLANLYNVKIVFINGLVPWTNDLTQLLGSDLNKSLSEYSKSILDFDTRDDVEIIKFFQQLQNYFATLNQTHWVNLFDSFQKNTQDTGPMGHHPGIISHQWMANKTANFLIENKIL